MYNFGPLEINNCSVEVFNKVLEVNPEADMRAIPNQWLLEARALNQSLSDRIVELEQENARLREAGIALRDDLMLRAEVHPDGHKIVDCSHSIWVRFKAALEEKENES